MYRLLLLLPVLVSAQKLNAQFDPTDPGNADSFKKLYGFATQIMELSGDIMGSGRGSGGGGGGGSSYPGGYGSLANNDVRPSFRGVRNFEADNTITSYSDSQPNLAQSMARFVSEYGPAFMGAVAPPTTTTTTTPRPNPIQSLFSTFLGSSMNSMNSGPVDNSEALPPPPSPRPRAAASNNFLGGLFGSSLPSQQESRSAMPPPSSSGGNGFMGLINNFMPTQPPPPTPPPTTTRQPQPNFMNMFGMGNANQDRSETSLGKINLWELMGMAPRTTTTTAAPLQALLNPGSYGGKSDQQNIDAVLNALMRSNAQRAPRQETGAAGLLSQFFGKKK